MYLEIPWVNSQLARVTDLALLILAVLNQKPIAIPAGSCLLRSMASVLSESQCICRNCREQAIASSPAVVAEGWVPGPRQPGSIFPQAETGTPFLDQAEPSHECSSHSETWKDRTSRADCQGLRPRGLRQADAARFPRPSVSLTGGQLSETKRKSPFEVACLEEAWW